MSYCEMLAMKPGGYHVIDEYRNAHGWNAYIWTALFEKYVPKEHEYDSWLFGDSQRLWDLQNSDQLSWMEKIVLKSTFDYVVIVTEDLTKLAKHYEDFLKMYSAEYAERVCHLSAMIEKFKELAKNPGDVVGVAWYGMSVSENPWDIYNEETEEYEEYDITKGDKHWFLEMEKPVYPTKVDNNE